MKVYLLYESSGESDCYENNVKKVYSNLISATAEKYRLEEVKKVLDAKFKERYAKINEWQTQNPSPDWSRHISHPYREWLGRKREYIKSLPPIPNLGTYYCDWDVVEMEVHE